MKFVTVVVLVSLMNVAFALDLGEKPSKDATGTECQAEACIQQRRDKAEAERKAKQQGAKSSTSTKK